MSLLQGQSIVLHFCMMENVASAALSGSPEQTH